MWHRPSIVLDATNFVVPCTLRRSAVNTRALRTIQCATCSPGVGQHMDTMMASMKPAVGAEQVLCCLLPMCWHSDGLRHPEASCPLGGTYSASKKIPCKLFTTQDASPNGRLCLKSHFFTLSLQSSKHTMEVHCCVRECSTNPNSLLTTPVHPKHLHQGRIYKDGICQHACLLVDVGGAASGMPATCHVLHGAGALQETHAPMYPM